MMEDDLTHWDTEAPDMETRVEETEHFDARGMRRVYGRGDHFSRHTRTGERIANVREG